MSSKIPRTKEQEALVNIFYTVRDSDTRQAVKDIVFREIKKGLGRRCPRDLVGDPE